MAIDIGSQIDRSFLTDTQSADAGDVKTPLDNLVTVINNILNGSQDFEVLQGVVVADPSAHATRWKMYFKAGGLYLRQSTAAGGAVVGPLGTGGGTDVLAKVSANDTTAGYLNGKLVAGTGISLTENNDGGNETLTIASTVTGGVTPGVCEGRLTLSSSLPTPPTDVTAATTLYFLPITGNQIALYISSAWTAKTIPDAGVSISIPSTTDTNYDVFIYDNTGTLTLDLTAWTDGVTRATALVRQNGVWVKTGATNRRYLGTIRTTGVSGQCEDSAAKRFVWNHHNRRLRPMLVQEATNNWTYATASWRAYNNSNANRVQFVCGLEEDVIKIDAIGLVWPAAGQTGYTGIGIDSTTTNSAQGKGAYGAGNIQQTQVSAYKGTFLGFHYAQQLEYGSTSCGFYGDNNLPDRLQAAIMGEVWG